MSTLPSRFSSPDDCSPYTVLFVGQRVRIRGGTFEGMHGRVADVDVLHRRAMLEINVFGRNVPVEVGFHDLAALG